MPPVGSAAGKADVQQVPEREEWTCSPEVESLDAGKLDGKAPVCNQPAVTTARNATTALTPLMTSSGSFACLDMCTGITGTSTRRSMINIESDNNVESTTHPAESTEGTDLSDDPDRDSSSSSTGQDETLPRSLCATHLAPFSFKASGHHLMFRTDDGKIAKESTHEEERFYTSAGVKLFKQFIVKYTGTATASVSDIQLVQSREVRARSVPSLTPDAYDGDTERSDVCSGNACSASPSAQTAECSAGGNCPMPAGRGVQDTSGSSKLPTPCSSAPTEEPTSPSAGSDKATYGIKKKCSFQKKNFYRSFSPRKKFILLRDVTHGYSRPCVLDIKMGIRNYGLNASTNKRRNKLKKTMATTSSTLGVCKITSHHHHHHITSALWITNPSMTELRFRLIVLKAIFCARITLTRHHITSPFSTHHHTTTVPHARHANVRPRHLNRMCIRQNTRS